MADAKSRGGRHYGADAGLKNVVSDRRNRVSHKFFHSSSEGGNWTSHTCLRRWDGRLACPLRPLDCDPTFGRTDWKLPHRMACWRLGLRLCCIPVPPGGSNGGRYGRSPKGVAGNRLAAKFAVGNRHGLRRAFPLSLRSTTAVQGHAALRRITRVRDAVAPIHSPKRLSQHLVKGVFALVGGKPTWSGVKNSGGRSGVGT